MKARMLVGQLGITDEFFSVYMAEHERLSYTAQNVLPLPI